MITIKDIESVLALFTEEEKENMMVVGNTVYVNFPSSVEASEKSFWIEETLDNITSVNYHEWEDIQIGAYSLRSDHLDFWFSFGFKLKGEMK